jgi:pyruvate dehydrogenase E1 component alpha subunit
MRLARAFEDCLLRMEQPGFQLLSRGEEAVAVGTCAALERRDQLLCGGRSIAVALARGVPAAGLLAELLGKDGGPSAGRGGRGHVSMPEVGFFGAHAVVAGNLTVAAGVALAQQQLTPGAVTACIFGDGACGSGALHETLNFSALWALPLVLVCSNNGYSVSTPVAQALAPRRLADLARPFGVRAREVDGTDVDQVAAEVGEAVAEARAGHGPSFLVLDSVRLASHSTSTREERPPSEMAALRLRDPLLLAERRLRAEGVLDDDAWAAMQAEVDAEIQAARRFAEAAPWPDPEEALSDG